MGEDFADRGKGFGRDFAVDIEGRQDLDEVGVLADLHAIGKSDAHRIAESSPVAGGTVTGEELERLPLFARSPLDFIFLLGGVTEEPLPNLYS